MIEKATFNATENDVRVGIMFTKVDTEKRTVSGFATLDNIDAHGDIVSASASVDAFKRFRGGLREMHTNKAVGTIVSFEETQKYDKDTDKVYSGVYVHARVSKGAPDTWEKVLDGTYKGFSIGGRIKKKSPIMGEDGEEHMLIEDYDLIELSLVDNPANPLATVLTVQKLGDTFVYSDVEKQYAILLHEESGDIVISEDEERDGFKNIGWTDSVNNTEKIRDALASHEASKEDGEVDSPTDEPDVVLRGDGVTITRAGSNTFHINLTSINHEGGATVANEETVEKNDEVVEEVTEEVEKAADVDEIEADDTAEEAGDEAGDLVAKVTDAVTVVIEQSLAKATEESAQAVESVKTSFEESMQTVNAEISKLKDSITDEVKKELESLAKRVAAVESGTAVKKSSDVLDDVMEDEDDGDDFWRGAF
jgi:hypothetical protein